MRTFLALALAFCAHGAVTRVEILDRTEIGHANYIRISAVVHYAVDPGLPGNRKIADLTLAPRNAKGLVEFSADVLIYAPKDPQKSNGTLLVEIPNRGGITSLTSMQAGALGRGITPEDLGDKFLFTEGFTLVWIGWQHDLPAGPGVMRLHAPAAKGATGLVHSEILVDRRSTSESLGDRTMVPYAVADAASATMTVRDTPDAPRQPIARTQWHIENGRVEYAAGFEPGKIYEVVYTAKDPTIAGLGMAAVRDYVSYIRQKGIDPVGSLPRTIAYGSSQSGRFLRTYLYDGFNADEGGHKVFDGVWAHISGGARGGFNQRFSQPSRMAGQWNGVSNPVDLGPFAPGELLAPAVKQNVAPKLILTNGSHEYWGRAASLNHARGNGDLPLPENVRMYFLAGSQHSTPADTNSMRGVVFNQTNPMEWRWLLRATLVSLQEWLARGTAPPASVIPSAAKGELTDISHWKFPKLPGVTVPPQAYAPRILNFGPDFLSKGIATIEPAQESGMNATLIPQVDADGNETGGIAMPDLRVPLATYTGWNLRTARPAAMYPLLGSMIPFAATKAERERSGDTRLSVEERYRDEGEYVRRVEAAARQLAVRRLILDRDIPLILARARARYRSLTTAAVAK